MSFIRMSRHRLRVLAASVSLAVTLATPAHAHHPSPSEASAGASALSVAVPVAVSVAGPVLLLSGAAAVTVASVQITAQGTVWVLERASDGARISVQWSGASVTAASMAVGTALTVTALSTGWLLSAAGEAVAFIPNEIGASLIHDERITH